MGLSAELLSQFVKVTKDDKKTTNEATVYGTTVVHNGTTYVQLDGSDVLTPVTTTADTKDGERVTVMIKNHTATITGNISSPAARTGDLSDTNDKITELDHVVAEKATVEQLEAEIARIDELIAENLTVENIEALNAAIKNLDTDFLDVAEKLTAAEADIDDLEANMLTADVANLTYATIKELEATNADVHNLEASYGDINTLLFGSATGNVIQTSFANAVIAQLGDAQIKSAMIDSVAAAKITAGDIITNNVRVKSQNGLLLISDETIQISDNARVRVQVGKDASNDYSINIWDADGNLMFSKGGITDNAIKEAIIRNDMVSDTANIAAHKLDIDSLFEEINGSTNSIKSTKVYLDDKKQTLDVSFKELGTEVTNLGKTVTSQGTDIGIIQGQISSKIWQQDIDTATGNMSTQYSTLEQNLNSFQTTVGSTYATKNELNGLEIGGRNLFRNTKNPSDASNWTRGTIVFDDDLGENVFCLTNATTTETTAGTHRIRVEPGETYTISAYVKRTSNVKNIDFFFLSREKDVTTDFTVHQHKSNMVPTANVWTKLTWTFVMRDGAYEGYLRIDHNGSTDGNNAYLYYTMVKMEKGNKATDWTPAPDDMATSLEISELSTKITQTESSVKSQAAQITNLGTNISTVEQTARGLTARLDAVKIGGRNLIAGTSRDEIVLGGYPTSGHSDGKSAKTIDVPTKDEYVLSFDAKSTVSGDKIRCFFYNPNTTARVVTSTGYSGTSPDGNAEISLTDSWTRYWVKYTQTGSSTTATKSLIVGRRLAGLGTGIVSVRAIKLEEGNQPTDWSPAPEDVDADVADAAKTATNYMNFSSSGLVVGDMTVSTLGKNVQIASDAVKIRTGDTVNAVFGGDIIELAKDNESATISMLNGAFKIYYDADNSDGGFGVYGVTSDGKERLAFQPVNENDNLTIGWGGYDVAKNLTNIYGNGINMFAKNGIAFHPGEGQFIEFSGNTYLPNGRNIFASNSAGDKRSIAIWNANDQLFYGYGSYVNSEGTVYYDGNTVNIRSKNDVLINGRAYGKNQVLWSGARYMSADHTNTLSQAISAQPHGIVLVFSQYIDGAAANQSFCEYFIPKSTVANYNGKGHCIHMSTSSLSLYATKYLYVSDTQITGHDNNVAYGTSDCGIKYANNNFVLRYVIGV